jgi:germination protein M
VLRAGTVNDGRASADKKDKMGKGPKASLGCLFWIAIILLAVVLFLFNQNAIMDVIKRIQNNTGGRPLVTVTSPTPSPPADLKRTSPAPGNENPEVVFSPAPSPSPEKTPAAKKQTETEGKHTPAPSASPANAKQSIRNATLYFVTKNGRDGLELKAVARQVVHQDAPLSGTLQALLKGPSTGEQGASVISLIPKNTRLLEVSVKGDQATINFSEEFRFNEYGIPGLQAQVKQIVYTATDFPNIARVQILIEGKKVNYLAQEGVYIGAPLTRKSF